MGPKSQEGDAFVHLTPVIKLETFILSRQSWVCRKWVLCTDYRNKIL